MDRRLGSAGVSLPPERRNQASFREEDGRLQIAEADMNRASIVEKQQNLAPAYVGQKDVPLPESPVGTPKLQFTILGLRVSYGAKEVLHGIDLNVFANVVTALIGPSGCGKSTFLRSLNRMTEVVRDTRIEGKILLDDESVARMDVVKLRRRVGMVFQRPNPFPKSIFDNVAYGLRINGYEGRLSDAVEHSLRRAALWDEVKD